MKHWRNNWEKFVGRKLQNAEAKPQSHVWELIEQELDAQDAASKSNTYKALAALVVLLLMSSVSVMLLNNPTGKLAYDNSNLNFSNYNSNSVFLHSSETIQSISVRNVILEELDEQEEILALTANVNPTIQNIPVYSEIRDQRDNLDTELVIQNKDAVNDRNTYASVFINEKTNGKIITSNLSKHSIASDIKRSHKIGANINPLTNSANINIAKLSGSIKTDINVSQYHGVDLASKDNFILDHSIDNLAKSGLQPFTNNLIASKNHQLPQLNNTIIVQNGVLVKASNSDLMVDQSISQLNISRNSIINQTIISSNQLAYSKEAMIENASIEEIIQNEEIVESKSTWMTEAMDEFNEWKEAVESSSQEEQLKKQMDESIEENLVDEAILDKEDPLTELQNAQKDLFYATNIHKGFHIGVISGVHNTWVARASRNSEVNRDNVKYQFTPGYQIGLNLGYDFGKNFGLMAELKYSDEGAKYYNPTVNRNEHLDLKYIEVPVYLKLKHNRTTSKNNNPMVFNYLAGVTFKDLRSVTTTINEDTEQRFAQDYNTSEWGISAGFDFDIYTNRNLFWTFGVRGGVSGWSKSFPKFKGEELGTITYTAGVFTRINFRKPTK